MKLIPTCMFALILLVSFGLVGCNANQSQATPPPDPWDIFVSNQEGNPVPQVIPRNVTGSIRIAGSSTAAPLMIAFSEEFSRLGFRGLISVESIGSAAGARSWRPAETSDILVTSYPLDSEQLEEFANQGNELIPFVVALDALAIAVHPQNTWARSVSDQELLMLFLEADSWNEIRPDWPDTPLVRVSPGTDSGTFLSFDSQVLGGSRSLPRAPRVRFSENDDILLQLMQIHPGSIGYLGYSLFHQSVLQLPVLSVNQVEINPETVISGRYPLVRELLVYVPRESLASQPAVAGFVSFLVHAQPQALEARGFFAPGNQAQNANAAGWNRVFHGRF